MIFFNFIMVVFLSINVTLVININNELSNLENNTNFKERTFVESKYSLNFKLTNYISMINTFENSLFE